MQSAKPMLDPIVCEGPKECSPSAALLLILYSLKKHHSTALGINKHLFEILSVFDSIIGPTRCTLGAEKGAVGAHLRQKTFTAAFHKVY